MCMSQLVRNNKLRMFGLASSLMLFAVVISLASCRKSEKVAASNEGQKTFASPKEAGTALLEAAKSGNRASLLEIFGPDGEAILYSGDPAKDKNALGNFVTAYETMN